MIDVTFTITEAEYLEAQELFMRDADRRSRPWRSVLAAIFIVGMVFLYVTAPFPIDWSTFPLWTIEFLIAPAYLIFRKPWRRRILRKRFQKDTRFLSHIHATLDQEGYHTDIQDLARGVTYWKAMSSWHENRSVILIKQNFALRFIPKRVLSEVQLEELRALLTTQIGLIDVYR